MNGRMAESLEASYRCEPFRPLTEQTLPDVNTWGQ